VFEGETLPEATELVGKVYTGKNLQMRTSS
jgi:hypothetical protein